MILEVDALPMHAIDSAGQAHELPAPARRRRGLRPLADRILELSVSLGWSISEIAATVGHSRWKVRRLLRAEAQPPRPQQQPKPKRPATSTRPRPRKLTPAELAFIRKRWAQNPEVAAWLEQLDD